VEFLALAEAARHLKSFATAVRRQTADRDAPAGPRDCRLPFDLEPMSERVDGLATRVVAPKGRRV
jgi:hypothetical protein